MITIILKNADSISRYAGEELCRILRRISHDEVIMSEKAENEGVDKVIRLKIDYGLSNQEVQIESCAAKADIAGGSPAALLCGVYLFLEKLGLVFEFSGEVLPTKREMTGFPDIKYKHIPSVHQRGIRMHLNFVQDQSFYTRVEFEDFIDNLARMKMNYLMFHMYTSQAWYLFTYRGIKHLELELGNLNRKPIAPEMTGRDRIKVENHWFPADLEHITDPEELLEAIYERYRSFMKRCHERGITTAVSLEPESLPELFEAKLEEWSGEGLGSLLADRDLSNNWQEGWSGRRLIEPDISHPLMLDIAVERCIQCIDAFPELDELQLISREGTGWIPKEGQSFEDEIRRLSERFSLSEHLIDKQALARKAQINEGPEMNPKAHPYWTVLPGSDYYSTVLGSLRFVEYAVNILRDPRLEEKLNNRGMAASIAVYSPNPETVRLMMPAVAAMLPKGSRFHLLADYGARDIEANLDAWKPLCKEDVKPGLISWLEFDGNMMLGQCWMEAIRDNITKARSMGIRTMYFNHWRVRSLEHNAAVAAGLCWDTENTSIIPEYLTSVFGKECLDRASKAYGSLEKATAYAKDKNYNIGFTNDWVFQHATDAPGYFWGYLLKSTDNFRKSSQHFVGLAKNCHREYGKRQAAYMADICAISALHIEAVQHLQNAKLPLIGYKAWPSGNEHAAWPQPFELKRYTRDALKACELEQQYMEIYSTWVQRCDEQGQLVMHQQGVVEPFESYARLLENKLREQQKIYRILSQEDNHNEFIEF